MLTTCVVNGKQGNMECRRLLPLRRARWQSIERTRAHLCNAELLKSLVMLHAQKWCTTQFGGASYNMT